MSMLKDEIQNIKTLLISLDSSTAVLVAYQYHTETNEYSKVDREKSRYRYIARVVKLDDLASTIKDLSSDAKRLVKFKWPDDPWPWYTADKYPEGWKIASWLNTKLKKIRSWEDGQKILAGWKNKTAHKPEGFNASAKYEVDGYLDSDGNSVSLTDRDTLLKYVGKNLIKVIRKQS